RRRRMTARLRAQINDDNRRWWALGAMCFALFMIMLDNTVVNVALPSIQRGLHATTSALEWTVNAYTLTFAVLLVTGGRLGDIFGRRRMFLFGVTVFGAASFLIALSQSDTWLIAFRAVQGIGSGFMMPATLSIITNAFDAHERGRAIGTWAGVSAMALAIGPVVGGFLVEDVSWQSIFLLNVPVAALVVAFIVSFVMFATFFSLALYMQDILHFSPLQTGIRFLPTTICVMFAGPLSGRLADRIGPRPLMAAGLVSVAASMFWMTGITTHSSYGYLVVSFILQGLGIGFVMSPMSTAAMNAVDRTKAGVASGILSMTRMVGSTFGVAALGAIIATVGRSQLATRLPEIGAARRGHLVDQLGSGASTTHLPVRVQGALNESYVYALSHGLYAVGALALVGALLAWTLVHTKPQRQPGMESVAEEAAVDAAEATPAGAQPAAAAAAANSRPPASAP